MFAVALVLIVVGAVGAVGGVVIQLRALAEASASRQVLAGLTRDQQRSVARALRDGGSLPPELLGAGRHAAQEVARAGVHAVTSASTVAICSGILTLLGGRSDTPAWTDVLSERPCSPASWGSWCRSASAVAAGGTSGPTHEP